MPAASQMRSSRTSVKLRWANMRFTLASDILMRRASSA
jgi:hypothetical protein